MFNAARTLGACLDALDAQDYAGPRETIVIDNGSTDGSGSLVRGRRFARLLSCTRTGPAAARNAGIEAARFEMVAFTDADCIPQPSWLGSLVKGLTPDLAGVGGPLVSASAGVVQDVVAEFSFNQAATASATLPYLVTANALFRRSALIAVSGFDERFAIAGGEDNDLGWRLHAAKMKIGYVSDAVCLHQHPERILDFAAQRFRYGYGERLLVAKHRDDDTVRELRRQQGWAGWNDLCQVVRRHLVGWRRDRDPRHALVAFGELAFFTGGILGAMGARRVRPMGQGSHSAAPLPMCLKPWTSFELDDQNGNVMPCCWTRQLVGNVRQATIADIWNGPGFQEFRRKMLEGDYDEMCPSDCPHRTGVMKEVVPEVAISRQQRRNIQLLRQDLTQRRVVLESLPISMRLLPSIRCNLECIMCWQREEADAELPASFYEEVKTLLPTMRSLSLQGGEPLLIKRCRGLIATAARMNLPELELGLITNGTLLSKRFLTLIDGVRLRWLFVSLDAAQPETYRMIRGGDFERVCEGIRRVTVHRPDIPIVIGFVVMNENVGEIADFIRLAVELNVEFEFSPLNPAFKKGDDFADAGFRKRLSGAVEEAEAYMVAIGRRNLSLNVVKQRMWNEQFLSFRRKRNQLPPPPRGTVRAVYPGRSRPS
jgi:MoaA/NifB/PqqE/SkfB family radical SAM enzyme